MTAFPSAPPWPAPRATRAPYPRVHGRVYPRGAAAAAFASLLAACGLAHAREQAGRRGTGPRPASGCAAAVVAALDTLRLTPAVAAGVRQGLAAYHGVLLRWPTDPPAAIRVWVQPPAATSALGARAARTAGNAAWAVVRGARAWDGVVRGLAFVPTRDSAAAAVRVRWESDGGTLGEPPDHPARGLHGHTAVIASRAGAITAADVTLGVGVAHAAVSPADLRAVAAHEFGHVLGLAHRAGDRGAEGSVMAADVRADVATPDDRAVLRAWYALPPGASCAPAATPPE